MSQAKSKSPTERGRIASWPGLYLALKKIMSDLQYSAKLPFKMAICKSNKEAAGVLRTMDWPPQSPDLNITECVWDDPDCAKYLVYYCI